MTSNVTKNFAKKKKLIEREHVNLGGEDTQYFRYEQVREQVRKLQLGGRLAEERERKACNKASQPRRLVEAKAEERRAAIERGAKAVQRSATKRRKRAGGDAVNMSREDQSIGKHLKMAKKANNAKSKGSKGFKSFKSLKSKRPHSSAGVNR